MEQNEWTEAQLIQFAQDHGFKDVTWRKIKRFRQEGVLASPRVVHLGFGLGTTSLYPADAGSRVLTICRLLKQRRDYDAVRFWLWLEGNPIEIGQLKASIWRLVPLSSLSIPETRRERKFAARKSARIALRRAWQSVRSNLLRKFLQQFAHQEDQKWFLHLQMDLLYGEQLDFSRDFLNEYGHKQGDAFEEPADIIAHGLQAQQIRFIREGEDIAKALQQLADEKLLSLTRLRTVLFAATEEDLELARTRRDLLRQLFEILDLMGYLNGPLRLYQKVFAAPAMQVMAFPLFWSRVAMARISRSFKKRCAQIFLPSNGAAHSTRHSSRNCPRCSKNCSPSSALVCFSSREPSRNRMPTSNICGRSTGGIRKLWTPSGTVILNYLRRRKTSPTTKKLGPD